MYWQNILKTKAMYEEGEYEVTLMLHTETKT